MPNRWPFRPETLIRRFERAVIEAERELDGPDLHAWVRAKNKVELARRDLLARLRPATDYQAKHGPG